jgi:hypothetical protein
MEKKMSMDSKQIAMLVTENQSIYMAERSKGDFFSADNDPQTAGTGVTKEPTLALMAKGTYPLDYMLDFLKLAKKSKTTHITIQMGREDRPIKLEFISDDNLNMENGHPKGEKTWFFLAPRIDSDYPELSVAQINEAIQLLESEIVLLKNRLPKEAPKAL